MLCRDASSGTFKVSRNRSAAPHNTAARSGCCCAAASRTGEGKQPRPRPLPLLLLLAQNIRRWKGGEGPFHFLHLPLAPDEAGQLKGQVIRWGSVENLDLFRDEAGLGAGQANAVSRHRLTARRRRPH